MIWKRLKNLWDLSEILINHDISLFKDKVTGNVLTLEDIKTIPFERKKKLATIIEDELPDNFEENETTS